jgi:HTH-type transcriptional regulator, competence development regulator
MQLADELRELREQRSLTLRALSEGTGISNAYLNQLEHDKVREPSPNILAKLADFYEVPYTRLMELAGYAVPQHSFDSDARPPGPQVEGLTDLSFDELQQVRDFVDFLRVRRSNRSK